MFVLTICQVALGVFVKWYKSPIRTLQTKSGRGPANFVHLSLGLVVLILGWVTVWKGTPCHSSQGYPTDWTSDRRGMGKVQHIRRPKCRLESRMGTRGRRAHLASSLSPPDRAFLSLARVNSLHRRANLLPPPPTETRTSCMGETFRARRACQPRFGSGRDEVGVSTSAAPAVRSSGDDQASRG